MSEQATDAGPLSPGDRLAEVVEFFGLQATGNRPFAVARVSGPAAPAR